MIAFFLAYLRGFSFFWLFELLIVFFFLKPFLGWVAISSFRSVIPFLHPPTPIDFPSRNNFISVYIRASVFISRVFFCCCSGILEGGYSFLAVYIIPGTRQDIDSTFVQGLRCFWQKTKDLNIFSDIICSPWLPSISSAVGSKVVDDIYPYSLTY